VFQGRYKSILVQNNAHITYNIVINSGMKYIFEKNQARTIIHRFSPGNIRAERAQPIINYFLTLNALLYGCIGSVMKDSFSHVENENPYQIGRKIWFQVQAVRCENKRCCF
jgi:hypothetical protein